MSVSHAEDESAVNHLKGLEHLLHMINPQLQADERMRHLHSQGFLCRHSPPQGPSAYAQLFHRTQMQLGTEGKSYLEKAPLQATWRGFHQE